MLPLTVLLALVATSVSADAQHQPALCIIGLTGKLGSRIAKEALERGWTVSGILRDIKKAEKLFTQEEMHKMHIHMGHAGERMNLVKTMEHGQCDTVVEALSNKQRPRVPILIAEVAKSQGVKTLVLTGGAGQLYSDEAKTEKGRVMNQPGFPESLIEVTQLHDKTRAQAAAAFDTTHGRVMFQICPPAMTETDSTFGGVDFSVDVVDSNTLGGAPYGDVVNMFFQALKDPDAVNNKLVGLKAKKATAKKDEM
jgi:putative NADH-flavin reductase